MSAKGEGPPGMTNLRAAVCVLVATYNKYAEAEGCKKTLNNNEFKTLIQTELPELLEKSTCEVGVNQLFEIMDVNGDKKVDFPEFVSAVGAVACAYHKLCPDM